MAGTSKIRRFFLTTTAGEVKTSEGNPENSKRDAVDVAPSVPAHEDEPAAETSPENKAAAVPTTVTAEPATAEPTTAEPARRGPVDQELDMTLDNPTDRSRSLSTGQIANKTKDSLLSEARIRIFYERPYQAHSGAMEIERQWLCFSPTMKKRYCQSCCLFGT